MQMKWVNESYDQNFSSLPDYFCLSCMRASVFICNKWMISLTCLLTHLKHRANVSEVLGWEQSPKNQLIKNAI